jgi:polyhydroxyalkanoate synthesis regulator phasin
MKVLLDIKDSKASSLMDVLNGLSYVKIKTISDEKALLIEEIKEAVENLKLVKQGKLTGRPARELLDEL